MQNCFLWHSYLMVIITWGFPDGSVGKQSTLSAGDTGSVGQEDPLEKEKATHSSILAWKIPWTEGAWWATVQRVRKVKHN